MKIKTLLFGAGSGVENFVANKSKNRSILAIVDNSDSKIGKKILNINIISPKDILNYDFDEIVITSMYIDSITNQLLNMGIGKEKIIIPTKMDVKGELPFEDEKTFNLASSMLQYFSKRAELDKKEFILDFGTLLGIARDRNIIRWDADIDIAITKPFDIEYENWIKDLVLEFNTDARIELIRKKDKKNMIVSYVINILKDENYKYFHVDISYRKFIKNDSVDLLSLGLWKCPSEYFKKTSKLNWNGINLQVPYSYIEYLKFLYGNWQIPKKDQTSIDYNNIFKVDEKLLQNSNYGNFYQDIILRKN